MLVFVLAFAVIVIAALVVVQRYYTASDPPKYYKDKVVILTGASEGIGAALAVKLAGYGCKLVICARRENLLNEVAAKCRKLSVSDGDVLTVITDVADEGQCKALVAAAETKYGRVDVIILNAALSVSMLFEKATPTDFVRNFNVNFMQAVYIIKAALPTLRRTHGKVVAISSLAALLATYGNIPYAASKAALHALMQNLRLEERGTGVDFVLLPIGEVNTATALGNMVPKDLGAWIPPEQCATEITDIVASRRNYYLFQWGAWFAASFRPLVPWFFDEVSYKYQRANYNFKTQS